MATERKLQQDDNNRSISRASCVNVCHMTIDLSFASKINPMIPQKTPRFLNTLTGISFFLRTSSQTVIGTLRQAVISYKVFWLDTMLAIILVFSEWPRNGRRLYVCRAAHLLSPLSRPLTTVEWIQFWWNNNLGEKTEYTENIPVSVTLSAKNHHQNKSVRENPHLTQY